MQPERNVFQVFFIVFWVLWQRVGNEGLWAFIAFICFYAYATERKLIIEIALLLVIGCSCGRIQGDTC